MIKVINHILVDKDAKCSECKDKDSGCEDLKSYNHVALDISLGTTNCGWLFGKHEMVQL
jgi:hypothetical protein